ncbi:phytanoyl-CoA dioxygenase domain-containing protein 1 homolog [Schistocerca americana]|uniref:phytanoyl-CoA dioxygenase domain-containing protein 1 homolog n=1 Tax=Schistocerca americana TaxID=7009 RepID=UPI001F4F7745|nr:phytanoyl-CoA dioxygenase domain-containing protein 1 homolog [Schistocerca americana]XP_049962274.1 phytanoyl-CoA dioxygenase domain-containing protein 1 homolog [Schistocerca serialis cubense]
MHDSIRTKLLQDGYVILDDFLSDAEVKELKTAGEELTDDLPEESSRTVFSTTQPKQNKDKYFLESSDKVSYFFENGAVDESGKLLVDAKVSLNKVGHALHLLHPTFEKYTFSNKVKETCWQLGFSEPVIVQSMYIYKNPGVGSEVVAHQDATFLHTEPTELVGFWFALDDATVENGCLWFAPGSHRSGVHRRLIRNPDPNSDELLIFTAPAPQYQSSIFQPVPVRKGTCVLIHGQVVHKSEHNKSQHPRHAYTFHVFDKKRAKYSPENWLQLKEGYNFPALYKSAPVSDV